MSMRSWLGLMVLSLGACVPSFEDRPWLVDDARVLAVASMPAEVRPSESLALQALVVSPEGSEPGVVEFAYCTRPRTVSERTSTTSECLEGESLQPVGATALMLPDACARFGPNTPPTEGDRPAQRPADPDLTGGYHVPIQAKVSSLDVQAFGRVRIRCDLVGATRAIFDEFEERYASNEIPQIAGLGPCGAESEGLVGISAGETVSICLRPEPTAAEPFVVYSQAEARLFDRRESLTVRWFVTGGVLDLGRQTVELRPEDDVPSFEVQWTAPEEPAVVHLWAVLSDARGGVVWAERALEVEG